MAVLSLIDRNSGVSRSFSLDKVGSKSINEALEAAMSRNAHLMTDEYKAYVHAGWNFAAHSTIKHRDEVYVNPENRLIHTNTVEGFFSIFKRGMRGIYQHCGEQHLHRYLAEFDFRYTLRAANGVDDTERAAKAVQGTVGKSLMLQQPNRIAA